MFDLCCVFEVQSLLSLDFVTVKASTTSGKNLEILCSLAVYAPNFEHPFWLEKVCIVHGEISFRDSWWSWIHRHMEFHGC